MGIPQLIDYDFKARTDRGLKGLTALPAERGAGHGISPFISGAAGQRCRDRRRRRGCPASRHSVPPTNARIGGRVAEDSKVGSFHRYRARSFSFLFLLVAVKIPHRRAGYIQLAARAKIFVLYFVSLIFCCISALAGTQELRIAPILHGMY